MAIPPIVDGDTDATEKFNLTIAQANLVAGKANTADVNILMQRESAARTAAIQVETDARAAAIASEASDRVKADTGKKGHPGLAPSLFTISTAGGSPYMRIELPSAWVVTNDRGAVARLHGGGEQSVGQRDFTPLEAGRVFRIRAGVQRRMDTPDPLGDAVLLRVAWYSAFLDLIGLTTLQEFDALTVDAGRQTAEKCVSKTSGSGVDAVAPIGACYFSAFVTAYGVAQSTDVDVLDTTDVTELDLWSPDLTSLNSRVAAQESIGAGGRLAALESAVGSPDAITFATVGALEAAEIGETIGGVNLLGESAVNDGRGQTMARTSAELGQHQSADGAWWRQTGVYGRPFASQAAAWAGANTYDLMNPLRTREAIEGGSYRIGGAFKQYRFGGNKHSSAPAFVIGGGKSDEGDDGVSFGNDGHSSWLRTQPTRNYSSIEEVTYPTAGQGNGRANSGTNVITVLEGTTPESDWVGRRVWFGSRMFRVAAATSTTISVTEDWGASVVFGSTYDETYHFHRVRGEGLCNVAGTTVTRISGDPFSYFVSYPFKLWLDGVPVAVVSGTSDTYTLAAPATTVTNVTYVWETDIDSQIATWRLQKVLGAAEENLTIAARHDGYHIRSQINGWGRYRPIIIGSGEYEPGALRRQIVVSPDGALFLGGPAEADTLRIGAGPVGTAVNGIFLNPVPLGTGEGPIFQYRGLDTNIDGGVDTKGIGKFTFSSGNFAGINFRIYGTGGTSWLAVDGALDGRPTIAAEGAASDIDVRIAPKNNGLFELSYAAAAASSPGSFSAGYRIPIKMNGTTFYVPASLSAW